jgi:hypothetical protein
MKILVACEFSQVVTKAFRAKGHEAYSCDILPTEGNPDWHIQDEVEFHLDDGWDLMIAHPPCTYLSAAGARWMFPRQELNLARYKKAMTAKAFFLKLLSSPIERVAIENPLPLKIVALPECSQVVQPYQYGHPYSKKTLLWLRNLPQLRATAVVRVHFPFLPSNTGGAKRGQASWNIYRGHSDRNRTFQGIADAMATQWTLTKGDI